MSRGQLIEGFADLYDRGAAGVFLVKNPGAMTRGSEPGEDEHAPRRPGPSEARVWA